MLVPALFAFAAVLFGAVIIFNALNGRPFQLYPVGVALMCAVLAVVTWLQGRKGGKPE